MKIYQTARPNGDQSLVRNFVCRNGDAIVGKIDNVGLLFIKTIRGNEAPIEP